MKGLVTEQQWVEQIKALKDIGGLAFWSGKSEVERT